jgi:hypothetical protein
MPALSPAPPRAVAGPSVGEPLTTLQSETGRARIFARASDVTARIWREAFGGSWKDFDYYRLLEETMRVGFSYQYLVLYDLADQPEALQPLILVTQDLAVSLTGALAYLTTWLRARWTNLLRTRVIMAGCLVGDGALGVTTAGSLRRAAEQLGHALLAYSQRERVSLITVKDFAPAGREDFQPVLDCGYTRMPGFPSLELPLTFRSFDEYMERTLSKSTRKSLRRKFRRTAQANPPLELEVLSDCTEAIDEIYPLYRAVAERSAVTFETFTREYFLQAGRRMPGRFRYFIWRQKSRAVAFSFCTLWGDTIYDNDIGLDYSVAYELNLYYVTYRDIITWALAHGVRRYVTAPFNYETKLHLGLRFLPHDLYVRHTSTLVNSMLRRIAPLFGPTRTDRVLRKRFRDVAAPMAS